MSSCIDDEWNDDPEPPKQQVEFTFPPSKNRGRGYSNCSNESSNFSNSSAGKDDKWNLPRGGGNGSWGERGNGSWGARGNGSWGASGNGSWGARGNGSWGARGNGRRDEGGNGSLGGRGNGRRGQRGNGSWGERGNGRRDEGGNGSWGERGNGSWGERGNGSWGERGNGGRGQRGNGRRGQRGNINNGKWGTAEQAKEDPISTTKNYESSNEEQTTVDWDNLEASHQEYLLKTFGHLAPVVRKTYEECKRVAQFTPQQVAAIRKQKNSISVTNIDGTKATNVPNLITQFHEAFENYPEIMKIIEKSGFTEPSPIQCQLWPIIMSGFDTIGIAQTGTGKTLAYLLPCLIHINAQDYFRDPERRGPLCIILAPTRELAQQIHEEVNKFRYSGIRSVCIYGQGDYRTQREALEDAVEIVVATPGRLYDFIKKDTMDVKGVSYLVLDEADRMLDMGFLPDISKITCDLRPDKQVVLTSATWACDVEYVVKKLMEHDKLKVVVGDLDLAAVDTVTQHITVCEEKDKFDRLVDMLKDIEPHEKVLVFCNRKAVVDYLVSILHENDISCDIMHGGLEQSDRENSLKCLKNGDIQVLLATDVASRGLDILDLTMVINLDLPKNLEEYVHRCGRTGRAGKDGKVISFVTWENRFQAQKLIDILLRTQQEIPRELQRLADKYKEQQQNRPPNSQRGGRGNGGGRRGNGGGRRGYGGGSYGSAFGSDIDAFF